MHEIVIARRPVMGERVERDLATGNQGKVQLGDSAPVFAPRRPVMGERVERDAATGNQGKVRLGDSAPVFGR